MNDKFCVVFDPFVSAKPTGLGMGLSICRRIIGNHDGKATLALPWASQQMYRELTIVEDGIKTKLVLFHYPIDSWNRYHHGTLHLHGHTHGNLADKPGRCDVGVDKWSMQPVTLPQIKERLATLA